MSGVNFRKLALSWVLSLPTPVLRLLSGGAVAYRGGRTLDPRLQFLAAMAARTPPGETQTPELARAGVEATLRGIKPGPEPGVRVEPYSLTGPRGPIPCRLYRPRDQDPMAPVMVFAHGGGGVVGDLDTTDTFCQILARGARGPVLSVEYRLAPEHKFPAGLEDVLAAYRHALDHAGDFDTPTGAVAIGGGSIGGNFAAVICQLLKAAGEAQPVLQLLLYPATDLAGETASMTTYADAYPMTRSGMAWFAGHYLAAGDDPADPRLSPLRAKSLDDLAPAVVITAGFDPMVDQGEAYARALRDAGVPVVYRCYDGLIHGFAAFTGVAPAADAACREIATLVAQAYDGGSAR